MPKPAWLAKYGERWAPYRSVASWYFWRYVDRRRELAKLAAENERAAAKESNKPQVQRPTRKRTPAKPLRVATRPRGRRSAPG
jgi:DNA-3-methyladenine glycosylase II